MVVHKCELCDYKTEMLGNLKEHKASKHNIDIVWHYCELCEYKCKRARSLKEHKEYVHDIGDNECQYCYSNRNSSIEYIDQRNIISKICRDCYKTVTGKSSRKELLWSDYIDEHLGTDGLLSSDKSLTSLGGCSSYRPDKIYIDMEIVEIGECDERQHTGANYSCEEKRLSEIYDEDGICGKYMYVLRFNPDSYKPPKGIKRVNSIESRYKIYVALAKKLRSMRHRDKIHVYYMFYTSNNHNITQHLPHTFIYDMTDVNMLSMNSCIDEIQNFNLDDLDDLNCSP